MLMRPLQGDAKMEEGPQAEKAADSPVEAKDHIDGAENSHEVSHGQTMFSSLVCLRGAGMLHSPALLHSEG